MAIRRDVLWIRNAFLKSHFGKIVVHGRPPSGCARGGTNRIGIDTGAFASRRMAAIGLDDPGHRFPDI